MKKNTEQKNWLEWTITVISGLIVAFVFGFLIYQIIYEEQKPPDIEVVLGSVTQKDGAFSVPITASNKGSETAENVVVEVTFKKDSIEERSEITFQYLPRNSSVKGWISFLSHPEPHQLKSRIMGYSTP